MRSEPGTLTMRWLNAVAWVAIGLGLLLTVWRVAGALTSQTGDFVGYYASATAVMQGFDLTEFYDDARFFEIIGGLGLSQRTLFFPNPPSIPILFGPFTVFSYTSAVLIWKILNVLLGLGLVLAFVSEAGLQGLHRLIFIAVALNFQPFRSNITHGQIYMLVAVGVFWVWRMARRGNSAGLGVGLGLMLLIKVFGAHLWLLAAHRNLRSAIAVAVAVVVVGVVATSVITGSDGWGIWLMQVIQRTATERTLVVAPDQSVLGTLGHLMTYDPQWNPAPAFPVAGLAKPLSFVLSLLLTGLAVWLARHAQRPDERDIIFAALALLSVVLSPYALDYTYSATLVPLGLWVRWLQDQKSLKMHGLVLAGIAMIALGYAAKSPLFERGVFAVLAHLKVYGALLLVGLAAHQVWWATRASAPALATSVQQET